LEAGPLPVIEGVAALRSALSDAPRGKVLIALDGVEDPQNVGSLARVADAAGVQGIVLTDRRSPPLSPTLSRASAGAIEWQRVARVTNLSRALRELKEAGFWVVAADPAAERTVFEFPDLLLSGDLVVVLGAEGRGLRPGILAEVDHGARLPMLGQVQSLNVATAGAILLYEIVRRRKAS
jgi:23S rRNA (guanosine2251-2'-O)-methyltransferase